MDPVTAANLALAILDAALKIIADVKANSGMTVDQIAAQADALDLQNKQAIQQLINL
jgi:hypothetical protein